MVNFSYIYLNGTPFIDFGNSEFSSRVELFYAEPTWVSFIAISVYTGFILRNNFNMLTVLMLILLITIVILEKSRSGLLYVVFMPFLLFYAQRPDKIISISTLLIFLTLFLLTIFFINVSGRELLDISTYARIVPFTYLLEQDVFHVMFGNKYNYGLNTVGNIGIFESSLSTIAQLLYRFGIVGTAIFLLLIFEFKRINNISIWPIFPIIFSSFFHPAMEVPIVFLSMWSVLVVSRYPLFKEKRRGVRTTI